MRCARRSAPAPVAGNLTGALTTLFGPVPVAIIPLVTVRDEVRAAAAGQARRRYRDLAQVAGAVSAYLADERAAGRIAADADIDSLTLSLVGGGHLLFADRDLDPPTVNKLMTTVLASMKPRPSRRGNAGPGPCEGVSAPVRPAGGCAGARR